MTDGFGLGDAYSATIERIKAQEGDKSRLGMTALMWVSHGGRPLMADELCHALAVELGSANLNGGNVPSISTLVSCCQGLITVNKETSTVRLVHFTLQEYFSARPGIFSRPHSVMADVCLTYLNSEQVKAISADPSANAFHTPFLEYCSVYWGVHAKRDISDYGRSLALELFENYDRHISIEFLLEQVEHLDLGDFGTSFPFSGLHCASFFGIIEVVVTLINMGCYDINEEDFLGYTPLAWAAHSGHEEVVKMLLTWEEVNPNKPNDCGQMPLSHAAWNGHEAVVRALLEREEVNPDGLDYYGQTPLSYAAQNGHETVVKILIERKEVNPDRADNDGQTPLSYAAWNGHEGVVKILLTREEVHPDKLDNYGQTPLSYAVRAGHEEVVKILLLRTEVNSHKPDHNGQTPFMLATMYGNKRVVELLDPPEAATHNAV